MKLVASGDVPDRLLSIDDVAEMLQIPVQSIYKQRSVGTFCRPTGSDDIFAGGAVSY